MQEVFEKITGRFSNIHRVVKNDDDLEWNRAVYRCTEIVKQTAAEYGDGWIPCSERLPEEYGDYLVAWKPLHMSAEYITKIVGRAVPHFYEIVEYDPDDEALWIGSIEQAQGEYEIIAWQPLPQPYTKGE